MTDRLILFDIDGTLVHVAEEIAFARALHEHCGGPVDLGFAADMVISDDGYVRGVLRRAGLDHGDAEVDAALARFVAHLRAAIAADESPVRPIAGAAALLDSLRANAVPLALATGCVEPSARAKLTAVGLHAHFPCGGFSHREQAREEILARAVASAAAHYGRRFAPPQVTYVGDGVWDIAAARAIGARFIGVNERPEGRDRLRAAGAEVVFSDYDDVAPVLQALLGR
ncbi:MAG: haloacid dehalogenase-like hydrolase [Deltaproteobacteria bacterium]|nr:haloacid dehalogenase-like hydrolase [Deltaproteobacteria bacterium]